MSMTMLNAIGSANQSISQFMFLGSNNWALADCATLNLLASGTTSVNLAAGVTGGFAAPGVFLGLSGPSSVGGNAFAFQINANTGAFTTYDLPSDFPFLTSFAGVTTNAVISSSNTSVFVAAWSGSNVIPNLLNLSQVCGLMSGGTSVFTTGFYATVANFVITDTFIYALVTAPDGDGYLSSTNLITGAISDGAAVGAVQNIIGSIGVYIFGVYTASPNSIILFDPNTLEITYTIQSSSMITPQNAFAFGDNLFLLNYTNNQAQSVNLANPASPQFSPVFPLDLSSDGTAPSFSWMDPSTGVYYQNVSGASTFANLSPMQF